MRLAPRVLAAAVAVLSVAGCTEGSSPGRDRPPVPHSMAALGDSITRGFAACGRGGDCTEASWATGTAGELGSHAQRLNIDDREHSHNFAVSGARVAGLASQVQAAVSARPDYVTVLIGANPVCQGHVRQQR